VTEKEIAFKWFCIGREWMDARATLGEKFQAAWESGQSNESEKYKGIDARAIERTEKVFETIAICCENLGWAIGFNPDAKEIDCIIIGKSEKVNKFLEINEREGGIL
jgi:hypothetical protein